mgnify:CR=1 FL=1
MASQQIENEIQKNLKKIGFARINGELYKKKKKKINYNITASKDTPYSIDVSNIHTGENLKLKIKGQNGNVIAKASDSNGSKNPHLTFNVEKKQNVKVIIQVEDDKNNKGKIPFKIAFNKFNKISGGKLNASDKNDSNNKNNGKSSSESNELSSTVNSVTKLWDQVSASSDDINIKDLDDLNQLATEENNKSIQAEVLSNIKDLRTKVKKDEIKCFLSNEADPLDSYVEIHAGAGGTESQDWADMLRRMYLKWSDNKNFKYQIVSEHKGDEAGIKSTTLKIEGDYIFGWLKNESGIHRLVRISPFDSGARRHTSFASVWVYPVVDENINIEILEKDLRIDTYRSSGAGGQHVNTTDSAVRITHIPSKIVVQCQNERSQHKNKETCMNMLKARLYDFEIKKKEQLNQSTEASKSEIGWGHQIRSYVLQPYRLVKDNRTNHESTSPDKVLDGEIDEFLEKSLYQIK